MPEISISTMTLDGNELTFDITVPGQGTASVSMTIDGDEGEGAFEIPGMGSVDFTAERTPEQRTLQSLFR